MPLYYNINSLEPSPFIWNNRYQKELPWCTKMRKGVKKRWICVFISSISYVHGREDAPWNKCVPQWTLCFCLISYNKTPKWNQEIEGTAMLLWPLKLCPRNNVFNCFVIIHWILTGLNKFSCRSVHKMEEQ